MGLSADQRERLAAELEFYRRFAPDELARFEEQVADFLASKTFVSDRGDDVDERTKLFIGAFACRLSVNLPEERFTRLQVINVVEELPSDEHRSRVLGKTAGILVTAVTFTRRALDDAFRKGTGRVVYHEMAHVLDAADGISDGVPPLLLDPARHETWRRVLDHELERLRAARDLGIPTALDGYGAKNAAELFAVATEAFFERPEKLRNAHPELFALLEAFYRQKPLG